MDERLAVHLLSVLLMFSFVYWVLKTRIYRMEDRLDKVCEKNESLKSAIDSNAKEVEKMVTRRTNEHKNTLDLHAVRLTRLETHIEYQTKAFDETKAMFTSLGNKLDALKDETHKVNVN